MVVTGFRRKLAALALIASTVAAGVTVFAQPRHPVCAAKQHDCGESASIAGCCCGDDGLASRDAGTPAQSRTDLRTEPVSAVLPLFVTVVPADVQGPAVQTSPPRSCPLDRPTLFAALLI